ncbi:MAG: cytochrome c-type biogenesis protein CcmH [Chloroflexi bacterium]|nr:cytochrome c-type biogenesis protein CcmH [Chloroflexota bacterium]
MKKTTLLALLGIVAVFLLVGGLSACSAPSLDEQAQDIYKSLMCPLCAGQTIEQSQSELSVQMRALVREKLAQGQTREEILQFFVEKYGEMVLAAPPKSGFNLLVWVVPGVAVVVGGFFLYRLIKTMQRKAAIPQKATVQLSEQERQYWEDRLKKELEDTEQKP